MRRSIRMNPGLLATPKQDADLLIALLEGDLQQLANALRRRGKVPLCHRIWQLPLYHAVVLSPAGSVPLLEAVAAAGAPIEVAEMSCFIVSKELQVVLDKKISPEQRSMVQEIFGSRRTAAELAAAHGRRDLLTALLDAGACPDLGSNCYALACAAAQQCFQGGPAQIEAAAAAAANTLDVLLQRGACADSCAEAAIDVYWRQRDQRNQAAAALLLCWILDRTMRQQRLRDSCDGIRCKLFTAAAAVGNARMVSHFTAHFTTLDPISYLGREVMMQAAESGNLTALQCLLQLAASTPGNNRVQLFKQGLLDARDHAADKALREQQPEALRLLLANGVKVTVQRINLAVAQWNMSQLQVLLSSGQPRPAAEVHGCRLRLVGSWQHDAYRACPVWNVFKMAGKKMPWGRALDAVQLLAAAGYRPSVFTEAVVQLRGHRTKVARFHPASDDPEIDINGKHRRLWLAANPVPWAPEEHYRFPPAFQAATSTLLLVAHRGSKLAAAPPLSGAALRRQRRIPAYQRRSAAAVGLGSLPVPILHHVMGLAAYPLFEWAKMQQ